VVSNIQYIFPLCTNELGEYITRTYNQEQSLTFWGSERKLAKYVGHTFMYVLCCTLIMLSIAKINTVMVTDQ